MEDAARLLKEAEVLYERHQAGRRDPFNVFTALRSPSDEVNLHSRFLHALLDHWDPNEKRRANLADFVTKFWPKDMPRFVFDSAKVEREPHKIDILITNDNRQALAIENKIYADDQYRQIERYYKELKKKGCKDVHVLYLTIDGRPPSEKSTGCLGKEKYTPISYGKRKILKWLGRFQKRAYEEPALRESVAQYLHLIEKMTGNDQESEYIEDLKELLLQDKNLVIAHDLEKVMIDARVRAMHRVWQTIKDGLREDPNSFGDTQDRSDISEERIKDAIKRRRKYGELFGWFGLYYSSGIEKVWLGVEASMGKGYIVGVRCWKQGNEIQYEEIRKEFEDMGGDSRDWWPWFEVVRRDGTGLRLDTDDLVSLSSLSDTNDSRDREALAQLIRQKLAKVRERLVSTS